MVDIRHTSHRSQRTDLDATWTRLGRDLDATWAHRQQCSTIREGPGTASTRLRYESIALCISRNHDARPFRATCRASVNSPPGLGGRGHSFSTAPGDFFQGILVGVVLPCLALYCCFLLLGLFHISGKFLGFLSKRGPAPSGQCNCPISSKQTNKLGFWL